jgi:hypothetical protein
MDTALIIAQVLTVATFVVGVAAIVNAFQVHKEKHGEPPRR